MVGRGQVRFYPYMKVGQESFSHPEGGGGGAHQCWSSLNTGG